MIRSDNKHLARRETMKLILNSVKYRGRARSLDFNLNPKIVISGDVEYKLMTKEKKKYGEALR